MRICIFGAGAIGGTLAVELALAGADLTVIARGRHLAAIKARGLTRRIDGKERHARVRATDDTAEVGPQDVVIVTLKAHSLPLATDALKPLFHENTTLLTAMNGVPYWYFHRFGGPLNGACVHAVDPGGVLWREIGPERALGCVVYAAAEIVEPGIVQHIAGNRFIVGEPDGDSSARVVALSRTLEAAGFQAPVSSSIRDEIWLKLWGNLSFNPLSALTGATLVTLATDPGCRAAARAMMVEGQAVAEALGVNFPMSVDERLDGAAAVGAHKTSMLQDLTRGRPLEIDALVTAVSEIGQKVGVSTPTVNMIAALTKQRARDAGCGLD